MSRQFDCSGNVEQHGDRLADLGEGDAGDVATNLQNARRRHRTNVLTLGRRVAAQSSVGICTEKNFGIESSDCGRQRNDVDPRWRRIEKSLRRHDHSWMPVPRFAALWRTEVEVDDVTRVRQSSQDPSSSRSGDWRSAPIRSWR